MYRIMQVWLLQFDKANERAIRYAHSNKVDFRLSVTNITITAKAKRSARLSTTLTSFLFNGEMSSTILHHLLIVSAVNLQLFAVTIPLLLLRTTVSVESANPELIRYSNIWFVFLSTGRDV